MAVVNGSTKIKLTEMHIGRSNPVAYTASYQIIIQDRNGSDVVIGGGTFSGNLGSLAVAGAKTLSTIQTEVIAAIAADPKTPANDSVA
jgi:hypothetical protein